MRSIVTGGAGSNLADTLAQHPASITSPPAGGRTSRFRAALVEGEHQLETFPGAAGIFGGHPCPGR